MSSPKVCTMYRRPHLEGGKLYLQGRVINKEKIEKENFIYPQIKARGRERSIPEKAVEYDNGIKWGVLMSILSEVGSLEKKKDIIIPSEVIKLREGLVDKFINESAFLVNEESDYKSRVRISTELDFVIPFCFTDSYLLTYKLDLTLYHHLRYDVDRYMDKIYQKWLEKYNGTKFNINNFLPVVDEVLGEEMKDYGGIPENSIVSKEMLKDKEKVILPIIASQTFVEKPVEIKDGKDNEIIIMLDNYIDTLEHFSGLEFTKKEFAKDLKESGMEIKNGRELVLTRKDWDLGFEKLKEIKSLAFR